jgi:hypothetical protein
MMSKNNHVYKQLLHKLKCNNDNVYNIKLYHKIDLCELSKHELNCEQNKQKNIHDIMMLYYVNKQYDMKMYHNIDNDVYYLILKMNKCVIKCITSNTYTNIAIYFQYENMCKFITQCVCDFYK